MLGLAEFRAAAAELQALGWAADLQIQKRITEKTSKEQAIAYANKVADEWDDEYDTALSQGTINVIANAADYYNNQLNLGLDVNTAVTEIQAVTQTQRFFGSTVGRRMLMNKKRLRRQIVQTAQVGPEKLGGLFTQQVPFGAHTNVGKRLMLGTMVQAEQNTARYFAKKGEAPFIRWVLSHRHTQEDECDERANYVDDDVVAYIEEHDLSIEPTGLYFSEELPFPPHPNCQCEYHIVTEEGQEIVEQPSTRVDRAFHAVRQLLQRIRGK